MHGSVWYPCARMPYLTVTREIVHVIMLSSLPHAIDSQEQLPAPSSIDLILTFIQRKDGFYLLARPGEQFL